MNLKLVVPAALALALGFSTAHAQKLTGFNAMAKLAGNTVTAKVDGKDLVEHYKSDGTVKHMEGGSKVTTGKWVLEGANVCFTYPGDEKACYVVEVEDDIAMFTSKTHGGFRATIVQGNPNKL